MKVVLVAKDKAGALPVRMENRPLHVEYLKGSPEVEQAGPILNADGDMCGSVIVLNVEDMADAEAWAKARESHLVRYGLKGLEIFPEELEGVALA